MPAVSPLAATAPSPTSVGGAVSADTGAFVQALARVEHGVKAEAGEKAETKSASAAHAASARSGKAEATAVETTIPDTVSVTDSAVTTPTPAPVLIESAANGEAVANAQDAPDAAADATTATLLTAVAAPSLVLQAATQTPVAGASATIVDTAGKTAAPEGPALGAEQAETAEVGQSVPLTDAEAAVVADAVEAAATTQAAASVTSSASAATTAALSTVLSTSAMPIRDTAATPAPLSRRAEGRSADAERTSGSAERSSPLEGVAIQGRTTAEVDPKADGSAATLLSAQMAGQMTDHVAGQDQAERAEVVLGAAGAATDEAAPLAAALAATTVASASTTPAAIHGSQLAASTIETTAQLAAQIARRLEGRSTRFDIALTPDDLGRVDVSLDIDADGGLTARLAFDNPLAATELRGRADELRRQLQDAGFTVGADSLSFSEREAGTSNGGSDQRFGRGAERAFIGAGRLTDDLETVAVPPAWISHSQTPQGVDLKV